MTLSSSDRYEILADLYCAQFGELAPGKDRPAAAGSQSDEDRRANNDRWSEWLTGRFQHPLERALEKIHRMQSSRDLHAEMLEMLRRYARECAECNGEGIRELPPADSRPDCPVECSDCGDIRALILRAEGGK